MALNIIAYEAERKQKLGPSAKPGEAELNSRQYRTLKKFFDGMENSRAFNKRAIDAALAIEDGTMTRAEKDAALGSIGAGILALSDHRLGGGYYDLPESIRLAAEGPRLSASDEHQIPYLWPVWGGDANSLSQFLRNAPDDLQGGKGFSATLTLSTGFYLHDFGGLEAHKDLLDDDAVGHLVDVSTRNKDANNAILTDEYRHPYASKDADLNKKAIEGLLTYDWPDEDANGEPSWMAGGKPVTGLLDWIAEDTQSESRSDQERAIEAAAGLLKLVGDEDEGIFKDLERTSVSTDDSEEASFTEYNDELANSMFKIFSAHLDDFAVEGGNEEAGYRHLELSDENRKKLGVKFDDEREFILAVPEDAKKNYMQLMVANQDVAPFVAYSVDVKSQDILNEYVDGLLDGSEGNAKNKASGAHGRLQGLLDGSLINNFKRESENEEKAIQESIQVRELGVGMVKDAVGSTKVISGPAAPASAALLEFAASGTKNLLTEDLKQELEEVQAKADNIEPKNPQTIHRERLQEFGDALLSVDRPDENGKIPKELKSFPDHLVKDGEMAAYEAEDVAFSDDVSDDLEDWFKSVEVRKESDHGTENFSSHVVGYNKTYGDSYMATVGDDRGATLDEMLIELREQKEKAKEGKE
ncbi:hypothetical protein GCM10009799_50980 [Nocardiopsis rhodophaea]|uniref:TPR repeat domain-containing protein n=2 Tax=Nocardiopsis rhodophaea TaxID=280238 RepID=A0ABP5F4Y5_9ACTN